MLRVKPDKDKELPLGQALGELDLSCKQGFESSILSGGSTDGVFSSCREAEEGWRVGDATATVRGLL